MPFVSIKTSAKLSDDQRVELKTRLGKLIEILPTKSEKGLMVDISDGRCMYHGGIGNEGIAFVDVRLFKESPFDEKKIFTEELTKMLHEVAHTNIENTTVNFLEMAHWGSRGTYR